MKYDLSFDNDRSATPAAEAFLRAVLDSCSLSSNDANDIAKFTIDAAKEAIDHAYPAGETGRIELTFEVLHGKVEIHIRDFGLPRTIAKVTEQKLPVTIDQMHWLTLGPQGNTLQLIKWLHQTTVANLSPVEVSRAEVPRAPQQEYEVRRMLPSEAIQVSQLMYRTYGNTYFNEDVYFPERIVAQNQRRELISVVAVGQDGAVASHCALERNQKGPVAEIGQAAVDPAHRGRGLLDRMKQALEQEARALDLNGWYADAVTVHTFTQQSDAHHGGRVCGVDLGVSPKSEAFRGIANQLKQRVSCVLYYRGLDVLRPRSCFVPSRHRDIVAAIYQNLQCQVEFGDAASLTEAHGKFRVQVSGRAGLATIQVEAYGHDSAMSLRHAVRSLVEKSHIEVVIVELPLGDPAASEICDALEADGLGFTGIGPHFSSQGDVLKLAYLVEPLSREPIQTFEPFAAQVVDYALAEQRRVRAAL